MRSRNDMPTVLEFAYLFVPNICESLKQLTDTGVVYYTSPHSYYEVPESTKIPFRDLPSISYPTSVEMGKEDQMMMGDWRDSFGKPVRQLTVRNQSTNDNVRKLPLHAYTTLDPLPRPPDFSATNEITATHTEVTEMQQVSGGACLFEANSVVVVKRDHIRGFPLRGPFFVGSILTDVNDKQHNSLCEIQLVVLSIEDCLLLRLHGRVSIHRDGIVGKVGEGHFQRETNVLKLSEASYETFLRYQNDIEYLLPKRDVESCEEDSDQDSEDDSPADVQPCSPADALRHRIPETSYSSKSLGPLTYI